MLVQLDEDDCNEIKEIGRIRSGKRFAETSSHAVKKTKGPLDIMFKKTRDTSINDACDKEARARTIQYIARLFYTNEVAFNVANAKTFKLRNEEASLMMSYDFYVCLNFHIIILSLNFKM